MTIAPRPYRRAQSSHISTAAATETFNDSTLPVPGIVTSREQAAATAGASQQPIRAKRDVHKVRAPN